MTIAFIIPDKRASDIMEPLWSMLIIAEKSDDANISTKILNKVAESLDDVPHFTNTCTFKDPAPVDINDMTFLEETFVCIDRRLALFVTVLSYSLTTDEHDVYFITAVRHLPSHNPENVIISVLETLEAKKITENIGIVEIESSEIKKEDFPSWFKKYISLWGKGKITDRQIVDLFSYLVKTLN